MKEGYFCDVWLVALCIFIHPILCCGFLNCTDSPYAHNDARQSDKWVLQCFGESSCPDNCTVSYYDINASDEELDACKDFKFESAGDGLSGFGVLPYDTYPSYNYNISLTNMKWNTLFLHSSLRASQDALPEDPSRTPSCLSLSVPGGFSATAALFLSHRHWGEWAGGFDAELQLRTEDGQQRNYSHLLYKVPAMDISRDPSDITGWVPLVAIEVSHVPWIGVVWPQLPGRFNVSEYIVELRGKDTWHVDVHSCDGLFCRTTVSVGYTSQTARICVSPVHENCSDAACLWEAPNLVLVFPMPWYVILLLVVLSLLLVTCSTVGVYCICCTVPAEPVKVLFLVDAVDEEHFRAARILREYLQEVANVECLYELEEVPRSVSKNASKWLEESLEEALFVLVFASPESLSPIRYSVYPNVFAEALPLLEQRKTCPRHKAGGGRVLVAIPPYLNRNDLPEKLRDWPFFYVPSQIDILLWRLYNPRAACAPISLLARCWLRVVGCPGPTSAYKHHGMRLKDALNAAGAKQTLAEQHPKTPPRTPPGTLPPHSVITAIPWDDNGTLTSGDIAARSPFPGPLDDYHLGEKLLLAALDSAGSCEAEETSCNGVSLQRLL